MLILGALQAIHVVQGRARVYGRDEDGFGLVKEEVDGVRNT